jgi:hypothetical protein
MARMVGNTKAGRIPDADVVVEEDGGAGMKFPTVAEVLVSIGTNNEVLQARIAKLLAQFPNGIPQQLLFDAINNSVSTQALLLKIGEIMVAAKKFSQSGKGPVGHASVEVV